MRALQIVGTGTIVVQEVPIPEIAADEVLVKVAGAGLCHSDLHVLDYPWPDSFAMTLGHETAGHVATMGSEVSGFAEGDAVLVCLVWACGTCRPCVEGRDNVCVAAGRDGAPPCPGLGPDGGMAEYIKVKARYLEPLHGLDPVTAGPLADAGLTPYHAIEGARARLTPGSTVAVIGVGGLGHVGLQILAATSAARLVAIDSAPAKLELARRYGADELVSSDEHTASAVLEMTDGYGADAVFDFVGTQDTMELATKIISPDGALRIVGLGGGSFPYTAMPGLLPWGVDVRRSYAGTRSDQRAVINLAAQGKIHLETQLYPLDEGVAAFADLGKGAVTGRAILVP